ncbi:tetratricopeptide repeat protein [Chitinophagaceae bacterium MMS25-I14]
MIGKYVIIAIAFCCGYTVVSAQERKLIKEGNNLYEQKKYKEAAAVYQQALQKNPSNMTGMFNLGNALYQGKQVDAARNVMTATAKNAKDKMEKSGAQYNLGNTYMDEKKWQDAVDYYKQSLRNNPQDADAKYNLSYAYTMMKKDQQNGGGKDKNKDQQNKDQQNKNQQNQQNKDQQNKDQKNKDQQGKDKQDKDQQNKDQQDQKDKDNQEGQHPEQRPGKLSEKQADQILNALQQEEKNLQEKKQKAKGVPVKMDKDW